MKKLVSILIILVSLFIATQAFGVDPQDVDIYVKSVPIFKVLSHLLGYKVYYFKENGDLTHTYIPMTWFTQAASKGEIIWGNTDEYPFLSIYWVDKEFYRVKLFLRDNFDDLTWGVLDAAVEDMREKFNIEAPVLEF